jgi:hypothetical protein
LLQKKFTIGCFALAGGKILPGRGNTVSTSAVITHNSYKPLPPTTPLPYPLAHQQQRRRLTHDNVYLFNQ